MTSEITKAPSRALAVRDASPQDSAYQSLLADVLSLKQLAAQQDPSVDAPPVALVQPVATRRSRLVNQVTEGID